MDMWKKIGEGAYLIDTHLIKAGHTACYLIVDGEEAAIFDSGSNNSTHYIMQALQALRIEPQQIKYHIVSHIHLDHAGGSGLLMQKLPNAKMLIHPDGAAHMIDPTALVLGSIDVYGKEFVKKNYGDLIPVSPSRIVLAEDGMSFLLGKRKLEVLFTPGHSWNHISILDATSSIVFAGDSMGVSYENALPNGDQFLFPTTAPTHFNPKAMIDSMRIQEKSGLNYFALTHCGLIENKPYWVNQLVNRVGEYTDMALQSPDSIDLKDYVFDGLRGLFRKWLSINYKADELDKFVLNHENDVFINGSGLTHWVKRHREKMKDMST